jgi:hypothetical protein
MWWPVVPKESEPWSFKLRKEQRLKALQCGWLRASLHFTGRSNKNTEKYKIAFTALNRK